MANLYFEELEIGSRSEAGPYLLSQDEIIRFARRGSCHRSSCKSPPGIV
jgi:hypothetical protein